MFNINYHFLKILQIKMWGGGNGPSSLSIWLHWYDYLLINDPSTKTTDDSDVMKVTKANITTHICKK